MTPETHKDGGPAFPLETKYSTDKGMTLRDYFAGQALAGLLTQPAEEGLGANHFAIAAYQMSDAMLKERSK